LTLKEGGYQIVLIAPAKRDMISEGIVIKAVPIPSSRVEKIKNHRLILLKALEERADIYHFHDPDLLLVGLIIQKVHGKPVVYDAHEDYAMAAQSAREYIPKPFRIVVAFIVDLLERFFAKRMAGVIAVDEHRIYQIGHPNKPHILIKNYPKTENFNRIDLQKKKVNKLIHLGTLSIVRGQNTLIELMKELEKIDDQISLDILGGFFNKHEEKDFLQKLDESKLNNLNYLGQVPYPDVPKYLECASIGLITWLPVKKHLYAGNPTKIFEYMASSIVTVASDFGIFRKIFRDNQAGERFDPLDIDQLVAIILKLVSNPEILKKKMINARMLFEEKYNWNIEGAKLLNLYSKILQ
jgi:glycosyltransferase involved in cell wall biosynthesis